MPANVTREKQWTGVENWRLKGPATERRGTACPAPTEEHPRGHGCPCPEPLTQHKSVAEGREETQEQHGLKGRVKCPVWEGPARTRGVNEKTNKPTKPLSFRDVSKVDFLKQTQKEYRNQGTYDGRLWRRI